MMRMMAQALVNNEHWLSMMTQVQVKDYEHQWKSQVRVNTLRQMTRCAASPVVHLPTLFDSYEEVSCMKSTHMEWGGFKMNLDCDFHVIDSLFPTSMIKFELCGDFWCDVNGEDGVNLKKSRQLIVHQRKGRGAAAKRAPHLWTTRFLSSCHSRPILNNFSHFWESPNNQFCGEASL